MARTPQRSGRWSLRQVSIEARVSLATAKAAVRSGHLDPAALTETDAVVLRVAAMLPALQPIGELRPANTARTIPDRERQAVALVRAAAVGPLPEIATLVITEDGARLAVTLGEVSAATLEPANAGIPYLALPVGKWASELRQSGGQEAA